MAVTVEDIEAAKDAILSADLLICQLEIAMQAVEYALNIASAHGIRTILNPAPARSIPAGLFQMAGILTPNETEAEFFSGVSADENDFEKCASDTADKLLGMGAGLIVMTLGENGAYIAGSNRRKHVKGFKIKAVDATAAGDAFNGALAVALAEGRDIEDAVVFANGAGALAASKAGAQASLCVRSELDEFLRSWVKHF